MKRVFGVIIVVVALLGAFGIMQGAMVGSCGNVAADPNPNPCSD